MRSLLDQAEKLFTQHLDILWPENTKIASAEWHQVAENFLTKIPNVKIFLQEASPQPLIFFNASRHINKNTIAFLGYLALNYLQTHDLDEQNSPLFKSLLTYATAYIRWVQKSIFWDEDKIALEKTLFTVAMKLNLIPKHISPHHSQSVLDFVMTQQRGEAPYPSEHFLENASAWYYFLSGVPLEFPSNAPDYLLSFFAHTGLNVLNESLHADSSQLEKTSPFLIHQKIKNPISDFSSETWPIDVFAWLQACAEYMEKNAQNSLASKPHWLRGIYLLWNANYPLLSAASATLMLCCEIRWLQERSARSSDITFLLSALKWTLSLYAHYKTTDRRTLALVNNDADELKNLCGLDPYEDIISHAAAATDSPHFRL